MNTTKHLPKMINKDITFTKVVEDSKWDPESKVEPYDEKGLPGRYLTSSFRTAEPPTLADIRRWAISMWKKAFGINIYEMAGQTFPFEFPNRFMAEQILQGEWVWKNNEAMLEWWSPLFSCCPSQQKSPSTWIGAIGLPLHLWSKEIFREIDDKCGGWKSTEEETILRNHLKWARIEVMGEARSIPNEVLISKNRYIFKIPIWIERQASFEKIPATAPTKFQAEMVVKSRPREILKDAIVQRVMEGRLMGESFIQKSKPSFEIISECSALTAAEWPTHVNYQNFENGPTGAHGRHMKRESG